MGSSARRLALARRAAGEDRRPDPGAGDQDAQVVNAPAAKLARVVQAYASKSGENAALKASFKRLEPKDILMADLQKIVNDLSGLTVLEAAELAKLLEEKWGVSAAAAVAVAAGPAAAAAPAAEEKTEFTVVLAATGEKKIEVIKEVAPSPASASRRQDLVEARPSRSRKASTRTKPQRSRRPSKRSVRRLSLSKQRLLKRYPRASGARPRGSRSRK